MCLRDYVVFLPVQCIELFSSMLEKVHSPEPMQYVLTQLADLTEDDKTATVLMKAPQGFVPVLLMSLFTFMCANCRDQLSHLLLNILQRSDKYIKHQVKPNVHFMCISFYVMHVCDVHVCTGLSGGCTALVLQYRTDEY